jgi:pimeloyl-ACP methyl ester carboxylesterase
MRKTFALLVGINGYPVKPLQGCINDVTEIERFLRQMAGEEADAGLIIKKLTDNDIPPTRQHFIEAFDWFLEAQAGDLCLLYYSGHGSYAPAPKEFWTATNGLVESLVLADSRLPGGRDLMDKELSFLIWKTFRKKAGVQLVVITDCCHSGTITKALADATGTTDRMLTQNGAPVAAADYYGYDSVIDEERGYEVSADGKRVTVRRQRHIHLAACRDNQTAKELVLDGRIRGAFTYSLLKTLYAGGNALSYRQLIFQTKTVVRNTVTDQDPGAEEVAGSDEGLDQQFLNSLPTRRDPRFEIYKDSGHGWCIRAGFLQGVAKGDVVTIEGLKASFVTGSPSPDYSTIAAPAGLDAVPRPMGLVTRQPNHSLPLSFDDGVEKETKTLITSAMTPEAFPSLSMAATGGGLAVVRQKGTQLILSLPGSERPIFQPLPVADAASAGIFLQHVAVVAFWRNLLELNNASTHIGAGDFSIRLYRNSKPGATEIGDFAEVPELEGPVYDFYYRQLKDKWKQPAFRCSFTNNSAKDLWFAPVYLDFDFAVHVPQPPVRVAKGQTEWIVFTIDNVPTDIIDLKVDKKYRDKGYSTITEYLKIFISTDSMETGGLGQQGLELAAARAYTVQDARPKGFGKEDEEDPASVPNDWTAVNIGLRITRPTETQTLDVGGFADIGGITVYGNKGGMTATVGLTSSATVQRTMGAVAVPPPNAANGNTLLQPYDLTPAIRSGEVMDVLELFDVNNAASVSEEDCLKIVPTAGNRTGSDEPVLAIGYDQETGIYYPVGYSDDTGSILIRRLPDETDSDAAVTGRSLLKSIKIYFQKVIGQKLGLPYPYPRLAVPTIGEKGEVRYDDTIETIRKKVAAADTVLLFIHGIIGDTKSIVPCIHVPLNAQGETLEKKCGLVLTFDYENLNTTIQQTAADLGKALDNAGFKKDKPKKLVIIAHSMGGLIGRFYIEQLGGGDVTRQLIMLGTPNNGTPWADVRDMAETLLTMAINGAAFLKPWTLLLHVLGKVASGTQVTFKQMDPKTGIYNQLNLGKAPGIPYKIIAGNTKDILVNYVNVTSLLGRIFKKIKTRGVYGTLDTILFRQPNDIAVSDPSIITLTGSDAWAPVPEVITVACDHLSYFNLPEVLELL